MMMVIFFIIDFMHFLGKSKMIKRAHDREVVMSGSSEELVVAFKFNEKLLSWLLSQLLQKN